MCLGEVTINNMLELCGYKLEGTELETVLRLEIYYSLHLGTTLNQDELKRLKHWMK